MSLVNLNRPMCCPRPRSGDLIDKKFHKILTLIEEGKLKQVEQMLNSERSLLHEKTSCESKWPSKTLLEVVCEEASYESSQLCMDYNDYTRCENLLKIAIKIIESDPESLSRTEKGKILNNILLCQACGPRAMLLPYLCLYGAKTPHISIQKSIEFGETQKKIRTAFLNGLIVIKTKFEKENVFNIIPKDVKYRIVKEGMELSCPYLFNFPPEILNKKMAECKEEPPVLSLPYKVWRFFFG